MRKLALALLLALPLPALAEQPAPVDPNALIIKHTEDEVANNPAVKAAKAQVGTAFGTDSTAKNDRSQLNQQIMAANEKYMQESREVKVRTPEEYQQFIQQHQQRFNNLNDQLRNTGGTQVQTKKQLDETRKQMRLVIMEARVDNPAFPVYITEGTSWEEQAPDGRLAQRILLRDSSGKRYTLSAPQQIDKLSGPNCAYTPIWGELWAVRGAEIIPPDPKAAATPVQLKVASLNQVYLLDHATTAGCPFGKVLIPVPKEQ